jgi:peptidoglycan hydrolase-like protein with peptidoglycan-binding domain
MPLDRELKLGDSGDPVKALQTAIARLPDTIVPLKKLRDTAAWVTAWKEETNAGKYNKATEAAVKAIQQNAGIEPSGALNASTIKAINDLTAQLDRDPGGPVGQSGRVDGRVLDASGRGIAGLDVIAAIVSAAGSDQRLATAKSSDDGSYVVSYKLTSAQAAAQIVGHLRVTAERAGKQIARSEILFNAPPLVQDLHLVASAAANPVGSDFERVSAAARAAAEKAGITLDKLEETDEKPLASLIGAETGHAPVKIALLSAAIRLERQSKGTITAELAYALGSQGVPLGLVDIAGTHPDVITGHIDRAVQRGIVSARSRDAVKPAVEAVTQARTQAVIAQLRAGPAGEQFARAAGGAAQADKFFALAAQHKGSAEDFWKRIGEEPALKQAQANLRFVAVATMLAGDHAATHAMLQKARDAREITSAEDLTAWTAADWLRRLQAAQAVAPGVDANASAAEKTQALADYAGRLDNFVEAAWPAAYAKNRIAASSLPAKAKVIDFLAHAPDFDLRYQRLAAYLASKPQAGLASETKATIEALTRVTRVARRIEPAIALVTDGLHSARSITALGPSYFARNYRAKFGSETLAREAHARARHITALSNEMYVQGAPHGGHVDLPVMAPGGVTEMPAEPDWASLFGHADGCACEHCQALTGPAAYLVDILQFLKKRNSRLPGSGGSKQPALDVLRKPGRRPDLCEIELTCENTETVLPYIDLVNEVLEDAVAPLPAFAAADFTGPVAPAPGSDSLPDALRNAINQALGLTVANAPFAISSQARLQSLTDGQPWTSATPAWRIEDDLATYSVRPKAGNTFTVTARSRQTRGPSSERLVSPQYVNKAAYTKLAAAVYPWTLPYDRPRAEARAILGKLETTLADVMTAFASGSDVQIRANQAIAFERLGLSPADADIIAPNAAIADPWRHWGFSSATVSAANPIPDPTDITKQITTGGAWTDVLASRVDVLLERGRLTYADLLALLDTLYVNPVSGNARRIAIVSTDPMAPDSCDTSVLRLQGFDAGAPMRIMRMARLSRRSGLSFADIDKALRAFGAADIDRAFLLEFAQAVQLNRRYDGDFERVLADLIVLSEPATAAQQAALRAYWVPAGPARSIDQSVSGGRYRPGLYERLFRAPGLAASGASYFPSDPSALAGPLSGYSAAALAGAIGVAAPSVTRLAHDAVVMGGATPVASLESFARLHRHARLMDVLGLTAETYHILLDLFDRNPFASPAGVLAIVAFADRIAAQGFDLTELAYLLRHQLPDGAGNGEEDRTRWLERLRAGLVQIADDNRFVAGAEDGTRDEDGSLTRRKLASLGMPAPLVDRVITLLSGTTTYRVARNDLPAIDPALIDTMSYRAPLTAFPAGIDVALLAANGVSYNNVATAIVASRVLNDTERAAVTAASADPDYLAALGQVFTQQDLCKGRCSYDPVAHELRFTGPMPDIWKQQLDSLSGPGPWRDAVQQLYDAPRTLATRLLSSFVRNVAVRPLASLPVTLPRAFDGRLWLDTSTATAQLTLSGPLLADERDQLKALAPSAAADQVAFRTAIDDLFTAANAFVPPASDVFLTAADQTTLFSTPANAASRFGIVLARLLPRLTQDLSRALTRQSVADLLQVSLPAAAIILQAIAKAPATTITAEAALLDPVFVALPAAVRPNQQACPRQHQVLLLLGKIGTLAQRLKLQADDLAVLKDTTIWPDFNRLPVTPVAAAPPPPFSADNLTTLMNYAALRDGLRGGRDTIVALIALARAAGTTAAAMASEIAARLNRAANEVTTLAGLMGLNLVNDLRTEFGLTRLAAAFAMLDRLGIAADDAAGLVSATMTADAGRAMTRALRAGMDAAQWSEVGRSLADPIRETSRAMLVDYLLGNGRPAGSGYPAMRWRDSGELLGYFLIDVEMCACMETSRLRQAMSSVQMFVQRCQLGLEPDVSGDASEDDGWNKWRWMRNYRVWEANRKVFLFPENWIRPELRDDKSPLFRELESALGQGEVTLESAARAYLTYLEKLDHISNLELVAVAPEDDGDQSSLHVVARTRGDPREHYYRRREASGLWSPWEKIDLTIDTDQVMLHVWNRRPFLFWPVITGKGDSPGLNTGGSITIDSTQKFEIKLAWSEFAHAAWTPQRQSILSFPVEADRLFGNSDHMLFRIGAAPEGLYVFYEFEDAMLPGHAPGRSHDGDGFWIPYPHCDPILKVHVDRAMAAALPKCVYNDAGQRGQERLSLPASNGVPAPALRVVNGHYYLVGPTEAWDAQVQAGEFLFKDMSRSFHVTPQYTPFIPPWFPPLAVDPGISVAPFVPPYQVVGPGPGIPIPDPGDPIIFPGIDPGIDPGFNPVIDRGFNLNVVAGSGIDYGIGAMANVGALPARNAPVGGGVFEAFAASGTDVALANRPDTIIAAENGIGSAIPALMRTMGIPVTLEASKSATMRRRKMHTEAMRYGKNDAAVGILQQPNNPWRVATSIWVDDYLYQFAPFYHPYTATLINVLKRDGLGKLLDRDVQLRPFAHAPSPTTAALGYQTFFNADSSIVTWVEPTEEIDFNGAYAIYNWELFFHIPMLIADKLTSNQRFDEARRWLHYIFDPTIQAGTVMMPDGTAAAVGVGRYWQTKPLFLNTLPGPGGSDTVIERERIERILRILAAAAAPDANERLSAGEREEAKRFQLQIEEWRKHPFQPHLIARLRTSAYQRAVVMQYLDNLIAWGDQLYRRDTMETVNEATQLYVMAAHLLGRQPETIPQRAVALPRTYASLEGSLDDFSNALVAIEGFVAPSIVPGDVPDEAGPSPAMLAFCVPRNDKLLGYWDLVGDRLFKIRHCMNIEGVVRKLALFEPPIDPGLLVKAAAAGVDIGTALADLDGTVPLYKFRTTIRRAGELALGVQTLGAALLVALEKKDSEALALLRTTHERKALERALDVRELQKSEAEAQLVALREQRKAPVQRLLHYARLLGRQNTAVPPEGQLIALVPPRPDTATHSSEAFRLLATLTANIGVSLPPDADLAGLPVSTYEDGEIAMMAVSQFGQVAAGMFDTLASVANIVPNFNIEPWGVGATFGGSNVGASISALGHASRTAAGIAGFVASMAGKAGQYAFRAEEWGLQFNLAARDIMAIDKQIIAADLRSRIAAKELANQKQMIAEAKDVEAFLTEKYTSESLYDWMIGQVSRVYLQTYQLAYDVAKRAEAAYRFELGLTDSSFISFGYWDSLKKGLMAGEQLLLDIRRLEAAHYERHAREYEMVKHVSLLQVDPNALIRLRETGVATVSLPEALFDLDCPGQYMRRIRSVAVTVPCVAGPYAGVHCKLSLTRSAIRRSEILLGSKKIYARDVSNDDPRFLDITGHTQSIVTSAGQNDPGMFEANMQDERYLPFEGMGVIGDWRIELPSAFRAFDYDTITDVILHIRYTARDAGDVLKSGCNAELTKALNVLDQAAGENGLVQSFSLRHYVPTAWRRFLEAPQADWNTIELPLARERFPYLVNGRKVDITKVAAVVKVKPEFAADHGNGKLAARITTPLQPAAAIALKPWIGGLQRAAWEGKDGFAPPAIAGDLHPKIWQLEVQRSAGGGQAIHPSALEDIMVIVTYRFATSS